MPTAGEGRAVAKAAGVGLVEGLWAGAGDEAGPKVGVQESSAHEVGTFKGGGRAKSSHELDEMSCRLQCLSEEYFANKAVNHREDNCSGRWCRSSAFFVLRRRLAHARTR